jgi:hypothetical protein
MAANSGFLKNYTIYRITCTLANTEYSQALSDRPTKITISMDDLSSTARFTFTALASGTGKQIFQSSEWVSPGFVCNPKTLYVQSPNAGSVVVVEEWQAP